jgi:hypothetical protein
MEHFCTPTRRYQDLLEQGDAFLHQFECTEVQFIVTVENFLVYRWEWKDLEAFLTGGATPKMLWLSENTFLVVEESGDMQWFEGQSYMAANIQATTAVYPLSPEEQALILVQIYKPDHIAAEVGVFWRAMASSNSVQLMIKDELGMSDFGGLPSGPLLSQFLRESPLLQVLDFDEFVFNDEHCRALATLQRTDLAVTLKECTLVPQDGTFIDWLRHNQSLTEINCCRMESNVLSALSGNTFLKSLTHRNGNPFVSDDCGEEMRALLQALPGNMGIENLSLVGVMSDKTWGLLFRSLSTHPRISDVSIHDNNDDLSAASKSTRMNAIL